MFFLLFFSCEKRTRKKTKLILDHKNWIESHLSWAMYVTPLSCAYLIKLFIFHPDRSEFPLSFDVKHVMDGLHTYLLDWNTNAQDMRSAVQLNHTFEFYWLKRRDCCKMGLSLCSVSILYQFYNCKSLWLSEIWNRFLLNHTVMTSVANFLNSNPWIPKKNRHGNRWFSQCFWLCCFFYFRLVWLFRLTWYFDVWRSNLVG